MEEAVVVTPHHHSCALQALQVLGRTPFGADWYVLGDAPTSYAAAKTSNNGDGLFTANRQGVPYTPRLLDYGSSKQSSPCPLSLCEIQ